MMSQKAKFTEKKQRYICELKIDGKPIDKEETDDYEVWYDKITDKIYNVKRFREFEIKIKICNS